tara:strand:+ start:584 stop:691 length:108 start_codon:yes stop_codon:yes gene_type:complete
MITILLISGSHLAVNDGGACVLANEKTVDVMIKFF